MATLYMTGNLVPSNTMMDLSDNAQIFDEFVNQATGNITLRTGAVVPVLQQQVASQVNARIDALTQTAQSLLTQSQSAADDAKAAKSDAEAAKSDAEAVLPVISDAANSASASAVRAELAADSIQSAQFIKAANNLSELADIPAARVNLGIKGAAVLDVGTVAGTVAAGNDSRIVGALPSTAVGYALIDAGTIAKSTRTVFANPFGTTAPVIVRAEAFYNNIWSDTGWVYSNSSYGVQANYVDSEGIVLVAGVSTIAFSAGGGGGHNITGNVTASVPVRIHIWK